MATPDEIFRERGELAALVRAKDWSQTSLGPPETWSLSLRTVLGLMLSSRYAMWLGWGPELLFFYNDAYASTLGAKHPWALGRPTREVWAEIWDAIGPRIDHVIATREATWDEGLLLFLERSGYAEETYHTFSYSPLRADDGGVGGMFCVVTEETEKVIGARRVALLGEFASALSLTKTAAEVLHAMEQCLARDGRDIPFSLTYLFDEGPTQALLSSRTGIRDDDDGSAPRAVPLGAEEAPWALDAILTDLRSVDVAKGADREWPAGPWSKPCARALVG